MPNVRLIRHEAVPAEPLPSPLGRRDDRACGKLGADVRRDFNSTARATVMIDYKPTD
jgi:hypothetical protein